MMGQELENANMKQNDEFVEIWEYLEQLFGLRFPSIFFEKNVIQAQR